jgi:long-subunit acyl-CoA synthetase (AMP-forming)
VQPSKVGEIWLKSPSCVQGHYKDPEATREKFTNDGWYKTGNVGFFQGDKLYLLDKEKVRHLIFESDQPNQA